MKPSDLDKHYTFIALSREDNGKLKVNAPIGLNFTKLIKQDGHVKCVEVSLMLFDDDLDITVEIEKDKFSPYKNLKLKYKWKDFEEVDEKDDNDDNDDNDDK